MDPPGNRVRKEDRGVCEGVYGEGATRQLEEISVSRNSILPAVPNRGIPGQTLAHGPGHEKAIIVTLS
jgi:hypothetical protein